jgi:hypothetical protein
LEEFVRLPLRVFVLAAIAAVALAGFGVHRVSADPRDFTLVNNTGATVFTAVYVSPSSADDWQDDVLQQDVLLPGDSVDINFVGFNTNTCTYDIKVVGKDGSTGELDSVDLCSTTTVTFHD